MLLCRVAFPDFCEPGLPSLATKPPAGAGWLHVPVRREEAAVRLGPAASPDRSRRALTQGCVVPDRWRGRSCDDDDLPVSDRLRYRRDDRRVFLYAFDLIELNGDDLRRDPLEGRKETP
jgi:hypothetical protein